MRGFFPTMMFLLILASAPMASGMDYDPDLEIEEVEEMADSGADEGEGVPLSEPVRLGLDVAQAAFLRKRAEEGDPAMQCLYGLALLNGSAGRTDRTEGEKWLKQSADAGDPRGVFEYGKMLYSGAGRDRDQAASLPYLRRAAENGNSEAAYYLGAALLVGEEVENDPEEGVKWLKEAAEAGIVNAQSDLGISYYSGLGGVEQDYAEALGWFTLAARQGHGDSANKLGVMYRHGNGVEADPERAILWFLYGANLGDRFAQYNLANSYMNGEWVSRNYPQAARWHEQSALRGNADSQYYMGCFYAEGIGVQKDPGRAREWLAQAHRNGHAEAEALLDKLYEMEDDAPPVVATGPARVGAAQLLRESSSKQVTGVDRGKELVLVLENTVEISPVPEEQAFFLTVPGYPGVIYCGMAEWESFLTGGLEMAPGMVLRARGTGFSGLPGFIRLENCRVMEPEGKEAE